MLWAAPAKAPELAQHRLVAQVDYILFARADVSLEPNPEEVQAVRYVDAAALRAMMAPESGLRWSPWFRRAPIACQRDLVVLSLGTQGLPRQPCVFSQQPPEPFFAHQS